MESENTEININLKVEQNSIPSSITHEQNEKESTTREILPSEKRKDDEASSTSEKEIRKNEPIKDSPSENTYKIRSKSNEKNNNVTSENILVATSGGKNVNVNGTIDASTQVVNNEPTSDNMPPELRNERMIDYIENVRKDAKTFVLVQVKREKSDDGKSEKEQIHFRMEADINPEWLLRTEEQKRMEEQAKIDVLKAKSEPPWPRYTKGHPHNCRKARSVYLPSKQEPKLIASNKNTIKFTKDTNVIAKSGPKADAKGQVKPILKTRTSKVTGKGPVKPVLKPIGKGPVTPTRNKAPLKPTGKAAGPVKHAGKGPVKPTGKFAKITGRVSGKPGGPILKGPVKPTEKIFAKSTGKGSAKPANKVSAKPTGKGPMGKIPNSITKGPAKTTVKGTVKPGVKSGTKNVEPLKLGARDTIKTSAKATNKNYNKPNTVSVAKRGPTMKVVTKPPSTKPSVKSISKAPLKSSKPSSTKSSVKSVNKPSVRASSKPSSTKSSVKSVNKPSVRASSKPSSTKSSVKSVSNAPNKPVPKTVPAKSNVKSANKSTDKAPAKSVDALKSNAKTDGKVQKSEGAKLANNKVITKPIAKLASNKVIDKPGTKDKNLSKSLTKGNVIVKTKPLTEIPKQIKKILVDKKDDNSKPVAKSVNKKDNPKLPAKDSVKPAPTKSTAKLPTKNDEPKKAKRDKVDIKVDFQPERTNIEKNIDKINNKSVVARASSPEKGPRKPENKSEKILSKPSLHEKDNEGNGYSEFNTIQENNEVVDNIKATEQPIVIINSPEKTIVPPEAPAVSNTPEVTVIVTRKHEESTIPKKMDETPPAPEPEQDINTEPEEIDVTPVIATPQVRISTRETSETPLTTEPDKDVSISTVPEESDVIYTVTEPNTNTSPEKTDVTPIVTKEPEKEASTVNEEPSVTPIALEEQVVTTSHKSEENTLEVGEEEVIPAHEVSPEKSPVSISRQSVMFVLPHDDVVTTPQRTSETVVEEARNTLENENNIASEKPEEIADVHNDIFEDAQPTDIVMHNVVENQKAGDYETSAPDDVTLTETLENVLTTQDEYDVVVTKNNNVVQETSSTHIEKDTVKIENIDNKQSKVKTRKPDIFEVLIQSILMAEEEWQNEKEEEPLKPEPPKPEPTKPHICNLCGFKVIEYIERDTEAVDENIEGVEIAQEPEHEICNECNLSIIKEIPEASECINCKGYFGRNTKFTVEFNVETKNFVTTCTICKRPLGVVQKKRRKPPAPLPASRSEFTPAFAEMVRRWEPQRTELPDVEDVRVTSYADDFGLPEVTDPPVKPPTAAPFPKRPPFHPSTAYSKQFQPPPAGYKLEKFFGRRRCIGLGCVRGK